MELAKANALKAINLDAGLAEAHVVLGQVAFQLDWNWSRAESAYQRRSRSARATIGPGNAIRIPGARGRLDQAFDELEEARRLNPLSDTNDLELVPLLQYARRFPEAETLTHAAQGATRTRFRVMRSSAGSLRPPDASTQPSSSFRNFASRPSAETHISTPRSRARTLLPDGPSKRRRSSTA